MKITALRQSHFDLRKSFILFGLACACLASAGCSKGVDTSQKLPLGWMDTPPQGAVLRGTAILSGWALSEDGIDKVVIYVDRAYVQDAGKLSGARADVIGLYPAFTGTADMQWTGKLETASFAPGSHEILTRAISKKGAVRDLGSIKVTIER